MRRMSPVHVALTGVSVAALTLSGAYAASTAVDAADETTSVVNKNGHEVDEHAADGQARAAEARAAAAARQAEKPVEGETAEAPAPEESAAKEDNGNHGGPDEAAGEHPDESAFLNPQDHEPRGPKPGHTNNAGGHGPDQHAGDHPDAHATSNEKGGKK